MHYSRPPPDTTDNSLVRCFFLSTMPSFLAHSILCLFLFPHKSTLADVANDFLSNKVMACSAKSKLNGGSRKTKSKCGWFCGWFKNCRLFWFTTCARSAHFNVWIFLLNCCATAFSNSRNVTFAAWRERLQSRENRYLRNSLNIHCQRCRALAS